MENDQNRLRAPRLPPTTATIRFTTVTSAFVSRLRTDTPESHTHMQHSCGCVHVHIGGRADGHGQRRSCEDRPQVACRPRRRRGLSDGEGADNCSEVVDVEAVLRFCGDLDGSSCHDAHRRELLSVFGEHAGDEPPVQEELAIREANIATREDRVRTTDKQLRVKDEQLRRRESVLMAQEQRVELISKLPLRPSVAHATGTAERDPTELAQSAQPASHRPTGACNTTLIIA